MTNSFNIAVCDDDNIREQIVQICDKYLKTKKIDFSVKCFINGDELLESLNEDGKYYDLLFLDVEMPGKNGLEIKNILSKDSRVGSIAFVTSHVGIIKEAFGLKVIGFIEKPLIEKSIVNCIEVVYESITKIDYVTIKKNVKVRSIDIKYIEVEGNYSRIIMEDNTESELMRESISNWEEKLDSSFIRCHKSFLVNMRYISCIKYSKVFLNSGDTIPIGRKYYPQLKEAYNNYLIKHIKGRLGWHS